MDKKNINTVNSIVVLLIVFAAIILIIAVISDHKKVASTDDKAKTEETKTDDTKKDDTKKDDTTTDTTKKDDTTKDTNRADARPGNVKDMEPITAGDNVYSFSGVDWLISPKPANMTRLDFWLADFSEKADKTPHKFTHAFKLDTFPGTCDPKAALPALFNKPETIAFIQCKDKTTTTDIGVLQDKKDIHFVKSINGATPTEIRVIDITTVAK